jgi:hypothetical protein
LFLEELQSFTFISDCLFITWFFVDTTELIELASHRIRSSASANLGFRVDALFELCQLSAQDIATAVSGKWRLSILDLCTPLPKLGSWWSISRFWIFCAYSFYRNYKSLSRKFFKFLLFISFHIFVLRTDKRKFAPNTTVRSHA